MNKNFKYRIYSNQAATQKLESWLSFCRHLYNLALEQRIIAYKIHRKSISKFEQMRQVTQLRQVFPEYNDINASVLSNIIKRLDRAYEAFFRRIRAGEKAGFPRFKSIDRYDSITFRTNGWKVKGKYLDITKVGRFKIKLSRPIEGKIKEVTLKRSAGNKWFVLFSCEDVSANPLPKTNQEIGIDMGCESFLTDSNNHKVENPRFFNKSQDILKKHQQALARKVRGSNRRKKQKIVLAKTYEKISNQRRDFHYKTANELLKKYDVIYIEKLKSWNSFRALNKSMRDVSWFRFFKILACKAEGAGKTIIEVPAKNTSQMCSACGKIVPKELKDRIHSCSCGLVIGRDYNAALNIYRLGQSLRTASPLIRELARDVNNLRRV